VDIIGLLNGIKGKVLDAAHFDILQSAYELQNRNIEQLKENNSALMESNGLLKEKSKRIATENDDLKSKVAELEAQFSAANPGLHASSLSSAAIAILQACKEDDATDFSANQIAYRAKLGHIQCAAAIEELQTVEFAVAISFDIDDTNYGLTPSGKKYVLNMG